ncbi:fatty acid desaturase [Mesorhizobium sp. LSHC422A00]|uniref:fatty acid desaturase family protein n=1 Tax=unclassified Mesorhizobium TaxID=325217 RepID=UPI0003CF8858|nr:MULTISPECIES: fatty acid desaturase family protein [unclassified Mesorhizobium]ESW65133.1 rhizopine catabolism protein [Mesorhizobium sp. LSJC277A00]ESX52961.1 fatty acid desaturase [Mesorhizobium sp. LSHC422A00]
MTVSAQFEPRDHRDVIASLTNEQRSRLTGKSDGPGLVQLAFHLGAIVAIGGLIAAKVSYWPLLMLPQGILIVFLFTLLHETVHRTAFETQWLNHAAARVCSLAIALPAVWFRYFHFAHHRFTQDPENDPELAFPKPETMRQYIVHVSGLPVWWGHLQTLYTNAIGGCHDSYVPPKGLPKVRTEARAMIAFYVVVAALALWFEASVLLYVWIVPALLGQPFLRLYLLAEHGRCPLVANMLENTRTTLTNWLVRKVAWNMPYHAEHHAYPGVPFHRLPAFHQLIERHLQVVEPGYVSFHEKYVETLR